LENLSVVERIILKRLLNKRDGCEPISFGSGTGPAVGSFENGNEPSDYIKREEILYYRGDYQLLHPVESLCHISSLPAVS
jgi:hypothetical protein